MDTGCIFAISVAPLRIQSLSADSFLCRHRIWLMILLNVKWIFLFTSLSIVLRTRDDTFAIKVIGLKLKYISANKQSNRVIICRLFGDLLTSNKEEKEKRTNKMNREHVVNTSSTRADVYASHCKKRRRWCTKRGERT